MGQKRFFKMLPDLTLYELDGKTEVEDKDTGKTATCSHKLFIAGRTIDPAFAGGDLFGDPPRAPNWSMRAIVAAETVRAIAREKEPGDIVALDEDDWERLKRATEKGSYAPQIAGSLVPFMRAICDATMTPPSEKSEALKEE